jgi:hypothetical protein
MRNSFQQNLQTNGHEEKILGTDAIRAQYGKAEKITKFDPLNEENENSTSAESQNFSEHQIILLTEANRQLFQTSSHSLVLKKWNGHILSINGEEFTAMLVDGENESLNMEATFTIDEVSEGDRDLIAEGALFDWVIGRQRMTHGQIVNNDFLIFRRFPMWKKTDLEKKSVVVDSFNEWLNSSSGDTTKRP